MLVPMDKLLGWEDVLWEVPCSLAQKFKVWSDLKPWPSTTHLSSYESILPSQLISLYLFRTPGWDDVLWEVPCSLAQHLCHWRLKWLKAMTFSYPFIKLRVCFTFTAHKLVLISNSWVERMYCEKYLAHWHNTFTIEDWSDSKPWSSATHLSSYQSILPSQLLSWYPWPNSGWEDVLWEVSCSYNMFTIEDWSDSKPWSSTTQLSSYKSVLPSQLISWYLFRTLWLRGCTVRSTLLIGRTH